MKLKDRILILANDGLENAGVQNVIMSIVRALKNEYVFDIVVFKECKTYYEDEFLSYGGKIFRIPKYAGNNILIKRAGVYYRWLVNYNKLNSIIKASGPYKAIHCHNDIESWYALKIAKLNCIPVRIVHTHVNSNVEGHRVRQLFNKFCLKRINKYATCKIGCSKLACETAYGVEADYKVVNNIYRNDKFVYTDGNVDNLNLLQIGSFCENKNQLFSVEIVGNLIKKYPNAKLFLVGFELGENYLSQIKNKIAELNLENNISILPEDADTVGILKNTAYTLFPSNKEGFGLVAVESQACGVRCIASDTVPKDVDCGGCTFLSLSLGAEKWADMIIEDYAQTKGVHGEFDCSRFTAEKVADEYRTIYEGKR